ncbi:MAG: hypothetical protein V4674_02905 [Patescibacteria group bacterium]
MSTSIEALESLKGKLAEVLRDFARAQERLTEKKGELEKEKGKVEEKIAELTKEKAKLEEGLAALAPSEAEVTKLGEQKTALEKEIEAMKAELAQAIK